jgi:integrase
MRIWTTYSAVGIQNSGRNHKRRSQSARRLDPRLFGALISPAKVQKRLPELLTDHELVGFYEAVWHARNPTHMIMIKLLIFTGLRNAELARVRLQDVDLDHMFSQPGGLWAQRRK